MIERLKFKKLKQDEDEEEKAKSEFRRKFMERVDKRYDEDKNGSN
jgi:hypothetical protein